ncbi:MAG: polysaccharide deacetylase family protein [Phycisphaerae bacterium]|nr:polysaccharide deacetylase family protein [Phycisphaerae bacterium]
MNHPLMGYYHRVQPRSSDPSRRGLAVDPESLRQHARLIRQRGLALRTVSDSLDAAGPGAAALSFDDGFADNLEYGVDALASEGGVGTVYVVVSAIRTAGGPAGEMLSLKELRQLAAAGWEIGSHSVSHPRLPELSEADQRAQVRDSKRQLEDLLGAAVRSFAYPYGLYSPVTVRLVQEAGYANAVTTAKRGGGTSRFEIPRLSLGGYGFRAVKQSLKLRLRLLFERPPAVAPS